MMLMRLTWAGEQVNVGGQMGVRAAATEATGRRILDAASALFGEQLYDQVPLAAVAARAGVTVQTVIRRFGSKEELYHAVARHRSTLIRSARDAATPGDVASAIEVLVAGYDRWGDEILHLLAQEGRSTVIADVLADGRRFHHNWLARVFAPQLGRIGDGPAREHELAKLAAVTDLYAWKVLRRDLGLTEEQTRAAITETVTALLGAVHNGADGQSAAQTPGPPGVQPGGDSAAGFELG